MKLISINFTKDLLFIHTKSQKSNETHHYEKENFFPLIPSNYQQYNDFTWDFEEEIITINDYPDGVYRYEYPGLNSHFNEMLKIMGFEVVPAFDLVSEAEGIGMPQSIIDALKETFNID